MPTILIEHISGTNVTFIKQLMNIIYTHEQLRPIVSSINFDEEKDLYSAEFNFQVYSPSPATEKINNITITESLSTIVQTIIDNIIDQGGRWDSQSIINNSDKTFSITINRVA